MNTDNTITMSAPRRALRTLLLLVAGLALSATAACGSDYQVGEEEPVRLADEDRSAPPDLDNEPTQPDPPDQPDPPEQLILAPVGGNTASVIAEQNVPLSVELVNKNGEAKTDQLIDWQLLGPNGDATLSATDAFTADDGTATVDFQAGRDLQTYRIQASYADPQVAPVIFEVTVEPLPPGILEVKADHPNGQTVPVNKVEVHLYDFANVTCSDFKPLANQQPAGLSAARINLNSKATFSQLDARGQYTATAVGYDPRGRRVAAGCGEGLQVPSDDIVTETLVMGLIERDPQGSFRVDGSWDMRQAFEKTAPMGKRLHRLIKAVANPGRAIWNGIHNEIKKRAGSQIAQLLQLTGIGQEIEKAINKEVAKIGFLQKLRNTAQGLESTLKTMKVESTLYVKEALPNGEHSTRSTWHHAYVWYKFNCGPNDPPSCGRHKLEFGGTNNSLQPVKSNFKSRVVDYDSFQMDLHKVDLEYGRLMLVVLNDVVIPELTNGQAESLEGAFKQWFSCKQLAGNLSNGQGRICAGGLCIDQSAVTNVCNAGVSAVFKQIEREVVKAIDGDAHLYSRGEARIGKLNADGHALELNDGTYKGYLENNNGQRGDVTGTWSGTRK